MDVVSYETAAKMWPKQAQHIDTLSGKKRSRERRKIRDAATYELLMLSGARCGNCPSFRGEWCDYHSDWSGKLLTNRSELCIQYHGEHQPKEKADE